MRGMTATRRRTIVVDVAARPAADRDRPREVQADPLQPALERGEVLAAGQADRRSARGSTTARSRSSVRDEGIGIDARASRADLRGVPPGRRHRAPRVRRHGPRARAGEEVRRAAGRPRRASRAASAREARSRSRCRCARARRSSRARRRRVAPPATRVLVVEDDANAFELIASALGSAGYFADPRASRRRGAAPGAASRSPLAVTLDLVLPGIDGWEVLKRLKSDDATRAAPGGDHLDGRQPRPRHGPRRGRLLRQAGRPRAPARAPARDHRARNGARAPAGHRRRRRRARAPRRRPRRPRLRDRQRVLRRGRTARAPTSTRPT